MMLLPNAVAELGMVQKLAREGDTCEKSCVCDAAQCNPLTIIPMGLSAGFVALGSTAPVLPSFEPCPNLQLGQSIRGLSESDLRLHGQPRRYPLEVAKLAW